MIQIAGSVSKGWLAAQTAVAFDREYYFDPLKRHALDLHYNELVREKIGDLDVFYTESNLGRQEFFGAEQVLVGGIQPNMIVGMLMGAEFLPTSEADADISARCMAGVDIDRLPNPMSLVAHPLIRQFDQQVLSIQADSTAGLKPIPPFFWDRSGRAAVHGAMTSGLKFFGDDFWMNMLVDPERCQVAIDWMSDVSLVLVEHFAELAKMPVESIHVGECASCMVDAENFERFVVPAASRLGQRFGGLRFHSCGRSDHIVEACKSIVGLASLDVGGESSVAKIRAAFGSDFPIGIAPLVEDMSAATSDGILACYERVERENGGGDLTVGFHLEAEFNIDNIRALHSAVRT